MRTPVIFDGRNLYDPEIMRDHGFIYHGVGRGSWLNSETDEAVNITPAIPYGV